MTKRRSVALGLMVFALAGLLVFTLTGMASAAEKFGLADIPEIKNKRPIHVAVHAGPHVALSRPFIDKFSEHTGVKVTVEEMIMSVIYPKINADLLSGTGAYDVTVVEASTTNEWAPHLWSLHELAKKFDPGGVAAFEADIVGQHPVMLRCASDIDGRVMGIPYYTYQQVMFLRQDAVDDPIEKENFKKKYGYELAPPTEWKHMYDLAQFFTRKKGEPFKGKPLEHDLYGTSIMAGRYEINDEISSLIWSRGVDWRTLVRDKNGKPKEFVITKENKEALKWALTFYKSLLPYVSPGCISGHWDYVFSQLQKGLAISSPFLYCPLVSFSCAVEDAVPGAKMWHYPCVGYRGYVGNFHHAVSKYSKNPEASYWFVRYIASYEAQKGMAEQGWSALRYDVLKDLKYQKPEWRRNVGKRAAVLVRVWNEPGYLDFVNDLFYFNSDAAGKIYEMEIILCHEAMTGQRSMDKTLEEITKQSIELQNKFGSIPMREEK